MHYHWGQHDQASQTVSYIIIGLGLGDELVVTFRVRQDYFIIRLFPQKILKNLKLVSKPNLYGAAYTAKVDQRRHTD